MIKTCIAALDEIVAELAAYAEEASYHDPSVGIRASAPDWAMATTLAESVKATRALFVQAERGELDVTEALARIDVY
jgi:hypothetical protein